MKRSSPILLHAATVAETLGFLSGQVEFMSARGFSVHLMASPASFAPALARIKNVPFHGVAIGRSISPVRDLQSLVRVLGIVSRLRPVIVHAHTPKAGLLAMAASWLARVPVRIYHVHGFPHMTAAGVRRIVVRSCERLTCRLARQVFCVSSSLLEVAVNERICPKHKIKVIREGSANGVDAAGRFSPARIDDDQRIEIRREYGVPADALAIGFVGRLVRDKGVLDLAAAWGTLRDEFPFLHLVVAGVQEKHDPLPDGVMRMLNSDTRIHLLGWVDDIARVYAAIDVLVLPSHREGFGYAAIEASAMARPVVASRIPGCVDAVLDGVTGTLVPPRDPASLARAIRTYLNDPALRDGHGSAGRERALRDFVPEELWEATYAEYVRLLGTEGIAVAL